MAARPPGQRGEAPGGQRRELGRLRHGTVPGREGRRDLPREQVERQVPRRDQPGHAHRPAQRVVQGAAIGVMGLARLVQNGAGEEPEVRRPRAGCRAGGRARPACHRPGFQLGQLLGVLLDEVGDLHQHRGSLRDRRPRPAGNARRAAATATATSRASPSAIRAMDCPVAGSKSLQELARRGRHECAVDPVVHLDHGGLQRAPDAARSGRWR